MDRFFIRLKAGESMALSEVLQKHLRGTPDDAERLLLQGSVWDNERKVRLRDGHLVISKELLRVDRPKFAIREYKLDAGDIKFEDEHILIVYKRGGVPVQPTPYSDIDNLLHGVQNYYKGRCIPYKAAPINRLDLPAQGLVCFAKSKKMEVALHGLFQERKMHKRYLAATAAFAGVKPSYIIRSALEWQGRSKEALTYVRFCRERPGASFSWSSPRAAARTRSAAISRSKWRRCWVTCATAGPPRTASWGCSAAAIRSATRSAAKRSKSVFCPRHGERPWGWHSANREGGSDERRIPLSPLDKGGGASRGDLDLGNGLDFARIKNAS